MKKSTELSVVKGSFLARAEPTEHIINGAAFAVLGQVTKPILSQKEMPFDQPFHVQFLTPPYESEIEGEDGNKTKYILANVYDLDEGKEKRIWCATMILSQLDEWAPDPSIGKLYRASAITSRICATGAGNTDGLSYAPAYVGRCFRITRKRLAKSQKGFNYVDYDIVEIGNPAPHSQEGLAI